MTKQDTTASNTTTAKLVGTDEFVYQPNDTWHHLPAGMSIGEAVGVATDSRDRLYVFNRGGDQPVVGYLSRADALIAYNKRLVDAHEERQV